MSKFSIPELVFMTREGDEEPEDGGCAIGGSWVYKKSSEMFNDKRVVVFSLPGAFTPTCSTYQLPGFEENYEAIKSMGIDEIYVSAVNDSFVMNAWAEKLGIKNVKVIPDGNGELADSLDMLIDMSVIGFGKRSRRFAVVINNNEVEKMFIEPQSTRENEDPYGETSPENVMSYLAA
jgi:thioredoxin-dependent peroxiredoxin